MSLDEHRNQIDAIDSQMVKLLNERLQHALAIGKIKLEQGGSIYAPHREKAVFDRVCALNEGPLPDDSLRAIYREIMSAAISLEKPVSIAFFGPEATYTHQAAIRKFGSSLSYQALKTIGDVFTEVSKGRADYGVVPVENSTEGVVTHTLDMFVDSELKIDWTRSKMNYIFRIECNEEPSGVRLVSSGNTVPLKRLENLGNSKIDGWVFDKSRALLFIRKQSGNAAQSLLITKK